MRGLLHGLFALAVLLGTWAGPQAAPAAQAETCGCCENEAACGCGMPRTPSSPRCPGGQQAQAPPTVLVATRPAPQAESASKKEALPWRGMADFSSIEAKDGSAVPQELPRPPDRLHKRLALLSTFRN